MYINAQIPPALTLAAPAEIQADRGAEGQPLKLQPFQIVRATVVEGGLERVVLDVNHFRFAARSRVPLRTGQSLNLQVVGIEPRIHLRIMEEAELRHLFRTLHSLNQSFDFLSLVGRLHAETEQNVPSRPEEMQALFSGLIRLLRTSPEKIDGKDLAMLWGRFGLDMEALLAQGRAAEARNSLKSALLRLAEHHPAPEMTAIADAMLDRLKLFQICRYRLAQEETLFLPLPFPFLEHGYLFAERERGQDADAGEDGREPAWKITLDLKMSFLGNLRILLLFEGSALRLRILCESEAKAGLISGSLPRLEERLTTVCLRGFSVGVGGEDPVTALVRRLAPGGDHFMEASA